MSPIEPHRRRRIIELLRIGRSRRDVARIVGVNESTVQEVKREAKIAPPPRKGNS